MVDVTANGVCSVKLKASKESVETRKLWAQTQWPLGKTLAGSPIHNLVPHPHTHMHVN